MPKVEEEAEKLLEEGFKSHVTDNSVLFFYMFHHTHPEMLSHPMRDRILNFSEQRDKLEAIEDVLQVDASYRYGMKDLKANLGQNYNLDPSMSVADQEYVLAQKVREEEQALKVAK